MKKNKYKRFDKSSAHAKNGGILDDTTEYGEFVCSFDAWLPIEEQKKNAEHMEHLGD